MSAEELSEEKQKLTERYDGFKAMGLKLNMSRGVPSKEQLNLSQSLLSGLETPEDYFADGADTRSYGMLDGIPSAKAMFGELLGVPAAQVIVGGNSSLNMMYDMIMRSMVFGIGGCEPWTKQGNVKFICHVPGYDRHFTICEACGIEMLPLPLLSDGPDIEACRELVKDPSVKGMWCVPKYSNPNGLTYSDDAVRALAALRPAAKDFRIYWDNAYCIHDIYAEDKLLNILDECSKAGNPNLVFEFASTSKISFPGSGVACMAAGADDVARIKKLLAAQMICPDKTNQLRHVRYFKNADGLRAQAARHADIIRPKFDAVLARLEKESEGLSFVSWRKPNGGYFISLDVLPGTAARTVALAAEAGVILTPAGSTWPYHRDLNDGNIRIAPTFPSVKDITMAAELLCICFKLAAVEKLSAKA